MGQAYDDLIFPLSQNSEVYRVGDGFKVNFLLVGHRPEWEGRIDDDSGLHGRVTDAVKLRDQGTQVPVPRWQSMVGSHRLSAKGG